MGWEVYYQVTLIPTPTRLTVLMCKREDNCNIMITEPIDYKLHMIF